VTVAAQEGPRTGGDWQVRYTWGHANTVSHPRFTYEPAPTESHAIDLATRQLDRMHGGKVLWLIEARRRHVGADTWTPVEWKPDMTTPAGPAGTARRRPSQAR
jgi:hypothetical protein